MSILTCHTDGCPNADEPIEMDLTYQDDDGETKTITEAYCGPCGQPITDIQEGSDA